MPDRHPLDTMSVERYIQLEKHRNVNLTPEEVEAGYRFCCEWDGLLIHASHPEANCCGCLKGFKDEKGIGEVEYHIEGEDATINPSDLLG